MIPGRYISAFMYQKICLVASPHDGTMIAECF